MMTKVLHYDKQGSAAEATMEQYIKYIIKYLIKYNW